MGFAPAAQITGALLLIAGDPGGASESLRTQGFVYIEDSAGMTVLRDPALQLILSSGSGTWTSARSLRDADIGSQREMTSNFPFIVEQSGFSSAMSGTAEVLSVSVSSDEIGLTSGNVQYLQAIIAQFN